MDIYAKYKLCPKENISMQRNQILSQEKFPRYKWQIRSIAKIHQRKRTNPH